MRLLKRLTLTALLLALAVTSFAAPDGWSRINGAWRNDGVAAQADAIERGGSFYLNLETRSLDIYPWSDGSTDRISMRPVLPVGVTVGELVETNWGWKAPMSNGWDIWLVDMQATKTEAYADYLSAGMALVYGKIPVAEASAHAGGEWRPKKIKFTAPNLGDYSFNIQPALTQQEIDDGATAPKWVEGSIAIYHIDKVNTYGHKRYMTGKIAHLPRPLAVGWKQGQITGWAFGRYEDLGGGVFEKVFDINGQFNADMTRKGLGDPVTISVSADLGYSTMGASAISGADAYWTLDDLTALSDGDVDSLTIAYISDLTASATARGGIYSGNPAAASNPLLANSDIGNRVSDSAVEEDFGFWNTWDYPTKPAITSGSLYHIAVHRRARFRYDTSGGATRWVQNGAVASTAMTDPIGSSSSTGVWLISTYMTYTPSIATPVTTNTTMTPTVGPKSTGSLSLSADIDSAETITAAEYYTGSDPGVGAATACTLTPLSGTSVEATATVVLASLPYGAGTVNVRGYDAVGGWGATDSDTFYVALDAPVLTAVGADEAVDLSWDAVDEATSYTLTWGTSTGPTGGGEIAGITGTTYQHTGRTNGVEYFYKMVAIGPYSGTQSAEVSAVAGAGGAPEDSLNINFSIDTKL